MQGSKWKVVEVVSLGGNGEKSIKYILSPQVIIFPTLYLFVIIHSLAT